MPGSIPYQIVVNQDACCEDAEPTQTSWKFVGPGRGSFAKVENFQFVGNRGGSYEAALPSMRASWCFSYTCCLTLLCAVFLGLVAWDSWAVLKNFAAVKLQPVSVEPAQPVAEHLYETPTVFTSRRPRYRCDGNPMFWSLPHQIWCCENFNIGCTTTMKESPVETQPPTTTAMPTTWILIPVPDGGFPWLQNKGTFPGPPSSWIQNQPAGLNWPSAPIVLPSNNGAFACNHQDAMHWSSQQWQWCCSAGGIICVPGTSNSPPEMLTTSSVEPLILPPEEKCSLETLAIMTLSQRANCCKLDVVFCTDSSTTQTPTMEKDTSKTIEQPRVSLRLSQPTASFAKQQWPAMQTDQAFPHADDANLFDCTDGFTDWQAKWTSSRQLWCCQRYGRACEAVAKEYDCSTKSNDWSQDQRTWCCAHHGMGC